MVVRSGVYPVRLCSDHQMSLNDSKLPSSKSSDKSFKLSDAQVSYLLINPSVSRLWYLKYRFNGKKSRIGLGAYPALSLAEA